MEHCNDRRPYLFGGAHSPRHSATSALLWYFLEETLVCRKPITPSILPLLVRGRLFGGFKSPLLTANHLDGGRPLIRTLLLIDRRWKIAVIRLVFTSDLLESYVVLCYFKISGSWPLPSLPLLVGLCGYKACTFDKTRALNVIKIRTINGYFICRFHCFF